MPAEPSGDGTDYDRERKEMLAHSKLSQEYLGSHLATQSLILIRTHMRPQAALMKRFLKLSGPSWERAEMRRLAETGARHYRVTKVGVCGFCRLVSCIGRTVRRQGARRQPTDQPREVQLARNSVSGNTSQGGPVGCRPATFSGNRTPMPEASG